MATFSNENNNDGIPNDISSPSKRLKYLYTTAFDCAEKSNQLKKKHKYYQACELLKESVQIFLEISELEKDGRKIELLKSKTIEFVQDITDLNTLANAQKRKNNNDNNDDNNNSGKTQNLTRLVRTADFYLESALAEDEQGNYTENALQLYQQAAEFYLDAIKLSKGNENDRRKYSTRLSGILSRAEKIKEEMDNKKNNNNNYEKKYNNNNNNADDNKKNEKSQSPQPPPPPYTSNEKSSNNNKKNVPTLPQVPTSNINIRKPSSGNRLSPSEIAALKRSSRINGRIFQPWLDLDLNEKFAFPEPFKDPDGLLALSNSQKKHFHKWARPNQFADEPCMISLISPYCIKQSVIEDCSFVSSLCIAASYERRFRKRLITNIIYPQNRRGQPVYNPCGKYMVKLWYNGVARKVIVDDRFPVDKRMKPLCSNSTNPNELWVSIIEKAYMKLNGGYEFDGSNSGIDLFSLTGWIPESFHVRKTETFDKDRTWTRLVHAHKYGDCLITVATGDSMTKAEADRIGLVTGHAYAVLDAKEVHGYKLLLVKNPWAHVRWKGPFCPEDTKNWTPKLRKALSYDQVGHMQMDNGIFWIDYGSLLKYYDTIFLNWKRNLFKFNKTLHGAWPKKQGPKNDKYSCAYNPQYALSINIPPGGDGNRSKAASVWILLCRHALNRKDVFHAEYITLHIFEDNKFLKRIFYPGKPMVHGTYSNNPNYLVRFDVPNGVGSNKLYTIVISQYEKTRDMTFSLCTFSTVPFKMKQIPITLGSATNERKIKGEWKGGANRDELDKTKTQMSSTSVKGNSYNIQIVVSTIMRIQLQAPKEIAISISLYDKKNNMKEILTSGNYRHGYAYCESDHEIREGEYKLVVSSWQNANAPYILILDCKDEGYKVNGV